MPISLTGHRLSVLGQGWCLNRNAVSEGRGYYSDLVANNSEVGVYSACGAACLACLRPVLLATGPDGLALHRGRLRGLGTWLAGHR